MAESAPEGLEPEDLVDEAIERIETFAVDFATASSPRLERAGLRYFERRSRRLGPTVLDEDVHLLDAGERRALRVIERGAILRAAGIGAVSALAAALAETFAAPLEVPGAPFSTQLGYWGVVGGVAVGATIIEIFCLYWDALRSVHSIACTAGISLTNDAVAPAPGVDGPNPQARRAVAMALARAALELPNPPENPFGLDPLREVSRWRLVAVTLAYKLKITVTNFVLKAVLRRLLGRLALRSWLVFVAIPVTAFWNAAVAWRVVREARIRAMGPSAARALVDELRRHRTPDLATQAVMLRAAAAMVTCKHELHPNLSALLRRLDIQPRPQTTDSAERLLDALGELAIDDRRPPLAVLVLASVLDGRLDRRAEGLVNQALGRCGFAPATLELRRLRTSFLRGETIDLEVLGGLLEPAGRSG